MPIHIGYSLIQNETGCTVIAEPGTHPLGSIRCLLRSRRTGA